MGETYDAMPPKKSTSSGTGKKITPVTASKTVSKTVPSKTATTTARGTRYGSTDEYCIHQGA